VRQARADAITASDRSPAFALMSALPVAGFVFVDVAMALSKHWVARVRVAYR